MGYVVTVYNKNDLCAKIFVGNRGEPVICEIIQKLYITRHLGVEMKLLIRT